MVADRAGGELGAVADDVVLDRLDAQNSVAVVRIELKEIRSWHVRHRERVMREVDLLLLLVPFVHRKVDNPTELEPVLGDEIELLAHLVACRTRELDERRRIAGYEEASVTVLQTQSCTYGFCSL